MGLRKSLSSQSSQVGKNLIDIYSVTLHPSAKITNGVISYISTAAFMSNTLYVPVSPNTQYAFQMQRVGAGAYNYLDGLSGTTVVSSNMANTVAGADGLATTLFTTPVNVDGILIHLLNSLANSVTINFSLMQLEQGASATVYEDFKKSSKNLSINSPLRN